MFEYDVIIENERTNTKAIIKECEEYFKQDNTYLCFLTQGDPNTLNIGIKPIFFDYNTSGYNSYIAEFTTFMWSALIADGYFCPKYHKSSYKNHDNICYMNNKYKPSIIYEMDNKDKSIKIECIAKTSRTRIYIINEYLKMLKRKGLVITKEATYFFIMRVLCIFDLREMEECDRMYCLYFIHLIYRVKENNKNFQEHLENIINNKMEQI